MAGCGGPRRAVAGMDLHHCVSLFTMCLAAIVGFRGRSAARGIGGNWGTGRGVKAQGRSVQLSLSHHFVIDAAWRSQLVVKVYLLVLRLPYQ